VGNRNTFLTTREVRTPAEEIHDAIVVATGVVPSYTMTYNGAPYALPPVSFAMQFRDTREPASNGAVAQFLNTFGRGDRDVIGRDSSSSPHQALNLMNNNFVMSRIHVSNNGSLVQRMTRLTPDPLAIIEELYLSSLSRFPTLAERRSRLTP
jgi:hypothetical protein